MLPTLERAAGDPPGRLYEAAFNPEFLRESTAVKDYFALPKIVVGEREKGITRRLLGMYDGIEAPSSRSCSRWPRWASSSTTAGTR